MCEEEKAMLKHIEQIFKRYYEEAVKSYYVKKPFAWALFQTWKEIDVKEIVREK